MYKKGSPDGFMIGSQRSISLTFVGRAYFDLKERVFRNLLRSRKDKQPLEDRILVSHIKRDQSTVSLHQTNGGPWVQNRFKHLVTFFQKSKTTQVEQTKLNL